MKPDQRRYLRRSVNVEFTACDIPTAADRGRPGWGPAGRGELVFDSRDVSPGGAFLRASFLLEEGEPLALEFTLPGAGRRIRADGVVAWVRRFPANGDDAGMGIRFTSLEHDEVRALEVFTGR